MAGNRRRLLGRLVVAVVAAAGTLLLASAAAWPVGPPVTAAVRGTTIYVPSAAYFTK